MKAPGKDDVDDLEAVVVVVDDVAAVKDTVGVTASIEPIAVDSLFAGVALSPTVVWDSSRHRESSSPGTMRLLLLILHSDEQGGKLGDGAVRCWFWSCEL